MNRQAVAAWLRRTYLEIDPRSLGLGRIGIGLLLLTDLARRIPWLRELYSNWGLLPNHTMLWRPPSERMFSFFFMASFPDEAGLLFLLAGVCFLLLLVGYRTRLFQFLSLLFCVSLHNRVEFVENGGAVAMVALLIWTSFLPLGLRFSIDAVLRARRGPQPPVPPPPFVSLAVLGFLLQLAVIYYFNFIHKSGSTWHDGTAVHFVLWQERIITHLGLWVRGHAPFAFTRALTYGTLVIEASAPLLILTPIGWRFTRPIAIVGLASLHIGIALMVNLGIFSGAMLAYYPFLLAREHWDWLGRRWAGLTGPRLRVAALGQRIAARGEPILRWLQTRQRPPVTGWWQRRGPFVREAGVAVVFVIVLCEVLAANPAVPRALKLQRPYWMVAAVMYPHLFEGWSMFSPDAPRGDEMVVVDAVTRDGRHVDPYNRVGSRVSSLPVPGPIPVRLGHDSFFCDYSLRIPGAVAYHPAFTDWILRYPKRTGNDDDEIVSFEAHVLEQTSPAPGEAGPRNVRDRVFLRYPQPH